MTRKMATIRKIDAISPIDGADAIEVATVGGWKVVVKKGEYTAGDLAIYCEIDSFIPTAIAPFLTKPGQYAKTFEGVEGERLRTVRLRKQLSQGLLLPLTPMLRLAAVVQEPDNVFTGVEGVDMSTVLGITKYEAPVPAELAGEVKGMFPSRIPKTDQERIQNLSAELAEWKTEQLTWEVTEKLEGSSMTVYVIDGEVGVCSRNLDLKRNPDNSLWRAAYKYELPAKLATIGRNIAIQGELVGNGIQGNIYQMRDQDFYVYDIYDIDAGRYLTPVERLTMANELGLNHVPVLAPAATLGLTDMDQILKFAEGETTLLTSNCQREGVVFKCHEKQVSFKAISNAYLLKSKD